MKPRWVLFLIAVLSIFLVGSSMGFSAMEESLKTGFTVLVGYPANEATSPDTVILGPGVIIPLYQATGESASSETRQIIEKSLSFSKAAEKLWATFRLDPNRRRQEGVQEAMAVGKVLDMPVLQNVRVNISAVLLKYSDTNATYKIVFRQGDKTLADSTVQVARGGRAVVGGMDGMEAPYIFLFIEPEQSGSTPARPKDSNQGEGFTEPRLITQVNPQYPLEAKKEKIQGEVVLGVQISKDGDVAEISVLQTPDPRLAEAAKAAVLQWKFEPAQKEGKPVGAISIVTLKFVLK